MPVHVNVNHSAALRPADAGACLMADPRAHHAACAQAKLQGLTSMLETKAQQPAGPVGGGGPRAENGRRGSESDESDDFEKGLPDLRSEVAKNGAKNKERKGSPKVGVDFGKKKSAPQSALREGTAAESHLGGGGQSRQDAQRENSARARSKTSKDVQQKFARSIFRVADTSQADALSKEDFVAATASDNLNLEISADHAGALFDQADAQGTGTLSFQEFEPLFSMLLKESLPRGESDEDDEAEWVHVGVAEDAHTGQRMAVYLHAHTGEVIEMAGENANGGDESEQDDDNFEFDMYQRISDGTVLTTYVDETTGQRLYVDGDTWTPLPDSWVSDLKPMDSSEAHAQHSGGGQDSYGEPDAPQDGPVPGSEFTFQAPGDTSRQVEGSLYQTSFTYRVYYDEQTGAWEPMPLEWESRMPSVINMLNDIDEALPEWQNLHEQVLALRISNYNVRDAIGWKHTDVNASGGSWNILRAEDSALIASLESALESKDDQIKQIKRAMQASDVIMEEQDKDTANLVIELEQTRSLSKRQTTRIELLEEELQQQFDDARKAAGRQKARTTNLELELNQELEAAKAMMSKRQKVLEAAEAKLAATGEAGQEKDNHYESRIESLEAELRQYKRSDFKSKETEDELEMLRSRVKTQEEQLTRAAEGGAAPLREQLAARTDELEAVTKKYKAQIADLNVENHDMADKLKQTSSTNDIGRVKLEAELKQYKAEATSLRSQLESDSSTTTDSLREKDAEIQQLRATETKLQDQVATLKNGTSKLFSKLKFSLSNLASENKGLRSQANDTIGRARKVFDQLKPIVERISRIYLSNDKEVKELRIKYQKEVLERKLLYNKIQELKGNIRVFCRVRWDDRVEVAVKFISETEIMVPTGKDGRTKAYEFDKVYPPETQQAEVYEDASGIIMSCIDGYNVCFMAYGQTGSGKTFTMMGPPNDPVLAGVNRRAVHDLFRICAGRDDYVYSMQISLLEIYNENIYDLLSGHHAESLRVIQTGNGGTEVENLIRRDVHTADDVTRALEEADENRSVAATAMNAHSSRSHLILQLIVTGTNNITGNTSMGKLSLVDLAGSERVGKSEATGQRLVEAAAINKSLTALGLIFASIGAGAATAVCSWRAPPWPRPARSGHAHGPCGAAGVVRTAPTRHVRVVRRPGRRPGPVRAQRAVAPRVCLGVCVGPFAHPQCLPLLRCAAPRAGAHGWLRPAGL